MRAVTPFFFITLIIPCFAATYTVDDDGPSDFNSIQGAIDFADNNDSIMVHEGTYYESIDNLGKVITLSSLNPDDPCVVATTIIDGNGISRCINATSFNGPNAVISGFTIRNGYASDGAGIRLLQSTGVVSYCTFINNNAGDVGGAMRCLGPVTIQHCNFIENYADSGGAIYLYSSDSKIADCDFNQNTSTNYGGAIYCHNSDPNLSGCNFTQNSGRNGGGITSLYESNPIIVDCNFLSNTADGWGGGLYCDAYDTDTIVTNCTFTDNWAKDRGGGMCFFEGSNSKVTGCTFTENSADMDGGGAYCSYLSDNTFENCNFSKNSAPGGGAIHFSYDVNATVEYCSFSENHADGPGAGGAIYIHDCNFSLMMSSFVNNNAYYGGGINNTYGNSSNIANISNCIFSGNSANNCGGLRHRTDALLRLENCAFAGNSAITRIGALENSSQDAIVTNCIFWANTAPMEPQIYDPGGIEPFEYVYCNIQGGWPGLGNIDIDPCFVEPGYWDPNSTPTDANDDFWVDGDYHLKSHGWRWDSVRQRWDYDDVTSRCIDAGNPGSGLAEEPLTIPDDPNNVWGHNLRINMGAYGSTAEASIPPYDWALLCDIDNSGIVDLKDFAWLSMLWLNQEDELFADFNRNAEVESNDLDLLIEDWLSTTTWH